MMRRLVLSDIHRFIMSLRWRRVLVRGRMELQEKMTVRSCALSLAQSRHVMEMVASLTRPRTSHAPVFGKVILPFVLHTLN